MPWSAPDGVCLGNARRPGARLLRPVVVGERAPAQQQPGDDRAAAKIAADHQNAVS
jgi:hypothetical protein